MELLNCPVSKPGPVRSQIAVGLLSKISSVNSNLLIKGRHKDLNSFGDMLTVRIV